MKEIYHHLSRFGDYSSYRLSLIKEKENTAPAGTEQQTFSHSTITGDGKFQCPHTFEAYVSAGNDPLNQNVSPLWHTEGCSLSWMMAGVIPPPSGQNTELQSKSPNNKPLSSSVQLTNDDSEEFHSWYFLILFYILKLGFFTLTIV